MENDYYIVDNGEKFYVVYHGHPDDFRSRIVSVAMTKWGAKREAKKHKKRTEAGYPRVLKI